MTTLSIQEINGERFLVPNQVTECDGFYISYNNYDSSIYGSDTTALVLGQMQRFYILNGNHVKEYNSLIKEGFSACFKYYLDNYHLNNRFSDKLESVPQS